MASVGREMRCLGLLGLLVCLTVLLGGANGTLEVTQQFATLAENTDGSGFQRVATDRDGMLVSCGHFLGPLSFPGADGNDVEVAGAFSSGPNLMCARFDAEGNALWALPYSYQVLNDTYMADGGISAVSSIFVSEDSIFISGVFNERLYLPCAASASPELCTAAVPEGQGEVPAIMLEGELSGNPFYAKLSLADGKALWAMRTSAFSSLSGDLVGDENSLYLSGAASITSDEDLVVPFLPANVTDVETVSFACAAEECYFVCAISSADGGAEWCHPYDYPLVGLVLGDGGSALYSAGEFSRNRSQINVVKLSTEDEGRVVWLVEKDVEGVEIWYAGTLSCYDDCQTVYMSGSYQYNVTVDPLSLFVGFVWAVDEAGNDQWLSSVTLPDASSLISSVESANALYVFGYAFMNAPAGFVATLDYIDGSVLQMASIGPLAIAGTALVEFTEAQAVYGLCGAVGDGMHAGSAAISRIELDPGVAPVYPSASSSPMPSPSPSPSPTPTSLPESSAVDEGDDQDANDGGDDDDNDWVWWLIGIFAVSAIIVALIVVVVGGVVYRRRLVALQAREDPYDYDMLSKDMFED